MVYRLYFLDATRHIKSIIPFNGESELAIEIAEIRAAGQVLELWSLDRVVMRSWKPSAKRVTTRALARSVSSGLCL